MLAVGARARALALPGAVSALELRRLIRLLVLAENCTKVLDERQRRRRLGFDSW